MVASRKGCQENENSNGRAEELTDEDATRCFGAGCKTLSLGRVKSQQVRLVERPLGSPEAWSSPSLR